MKAAGQAGAIAAAPSLQALNGELAVRLAQRCPIIARSHRLRRCRCRGFAVIIVSCSRGKSRQDLSNIWSVFRDARGVGLSCCEFHHRIHFLFQPEAADRITESFHHHHPPPRASSQPYHSHPLSQKDGGRHRQDPRSSRALSAVQILRPPLSQTRDKAASSQRASRTTSAIPFAVPTRSIYKTHAANVTPRPW